jgi:anti-sigma B factor antagonist
MAATMQPPQWSCTTVAEDGRIVIRPRGELDLATADDLRDAISSALGRGEPTTVDLAGLTFVDSTGLGCFLAAAETARQADVALELLPGGDGVMRLFELTGTLDVLPFRRTS